MKRYITVLLCLVLMLFASACGNDTETPEPSSSPQSAPTRKEKILKLEQCPYLETEATEPSVMDVNIAYDGLSELNTTGISNNSELNVFAAFIRYEFGVDINDKWHVTVHFYNDEQTCGMLEFQYYIGDIGTDKHFLFNLDNGTADMLYYANIDCDTDEQALNASVAKFNDKYEQEKYQFKDDEELESECVSYTYNYKSGKLVYCYSVFFYYGPDRIINNDYGTACFIDKDGNAIFE